MVSPDSTSPELPPRQSHEIVWLGGFVATAVFWWLIVVGVYVSLAGYLNETISGALGDSRVVRTLIGVVETGLLAILVAPSMFFLSTVVRYELGRRKPMSGFRLRDHRIWNVFWRCVSCGMLAPFYDGFIMGVVALFVAFCVFFAPIQPWPIVLISSALSFSVVFLAVNLDNEEFGTDESE